MRWAIKLSALRYVVKHLPGERKVWADMLTRWAVKNPAQVQAFSVTRVKALMVLKSVQERTKNSVCKV